jgi:hypothetical protein
LPVRETAKTLVLSIGRAGSLIAFEPISGRAAAGDSALQAGFKRLPLRLGSKASWLRKTLFRVSPALIVLVPSFSLVAPGFAAKCASNRQPIQLPSLRLIGAANILDLRRETRPSRKRCRERLYRRHADWTLALPDDSLSRASPIQH